MAGHGAAVDRSEEWAALREQYLKSSEYRPPSSARGVHHIALLSSDVEATIAFYQGVLEFPLTELFENRDYHGSTHFFFDIGHGNLLAFFDFPGLDLGDYAEVLGGLHLIAMDEPEHRLYRALVAPAFRPKVLERWQTTVVQPAIDNVIDTFIDQDRVDLVEHLTFAFPVRVIARILGLPEQDVANFQRWSLDLINMFNDPEPGVRALEEFRSYFMAFIAERRLAPRDDLISDLIESEVDGHRLDDDAIFASVKMLLPAGVETTYRSLGNLLVGLLTHTDQLHALQHDRALIGPAIEEGLRWQTPFLMVARQTARDTDLAGIHIPAEQPVFIFVAAANHDERRYPDPEAFNISRVPTAHIAFGTGPHICLGMHLTRVESHAALERILDRAPNIRLDPDEPEPRIRGTVLRSPDALNVLLR